MKYTVPFFFLPDRGERYYKKEGRRLRTRVPNLATYGILQTLCNKGHGLFNNKHACAQPLLGCLEFYSPAADPVYGHLIYGGPIYCGESSNRRRVETGEMGFVTPNAIPLK